MNQIGIKDVAGARINPSKEDGNLSNIKTAVELIDDTVATISATVVQRVGIFDDADTQITTFGGNATQDSAAPSQDSMNFLEYKDFDGAALPNSVDTEGDAVRSAGSAYGVNYVMQVSEDGSQSPYDSINNALNVSEIAPGVLTQTKDTGITQLTAPGDTAEQLVNNLSIYGYTFTVASIDTNVIVGLEGSIDETNYAELPLKNTAVTNVTISSNRMTITANDTYCIYSDAPMVDVRFVFISESGGTNATIDADFFGRR